MSTVTTKLRTHAHERATRLADEHDSNRTEVIDAALDEFERTEASRRQEAIARVRTVHPAPYPRTGRGNRRRILPAPQSAAA